MKRTAVNKLVILLKMASVASLLVCAAPLLLSGCASRMLYYPTQRDYGNPAAHGLAFEAVTFPSADGTALTGWFMPAQGKAKGTVLHFHGNAENVSANLAYVSWLPPAGYNVFMFDYRGYGGSGGSPSRSGVHEDACAALHYVRSRSDVDPSRLLVLGQSLGGATALAAIHAEGTNGIRAVAIDSTFYSYRLVTRDAIGRMPVVRFLRWPLSFLVISNDKSPASYVRELSPIPVLIFHGTDDEVIPYRHGTMLFERAGEPKEFVAVPGGRHTDALTRKDSAFRARLLRFFDDTMLARR